tara:strand:+ start:709 stop:927 length:219 start_codon:yes stop_codon:yes gene_type:complete
MTSNPKKDYSTLARWLCLFEAVNIISEKAEKIGHAPDCLKPIPINKYIQERYHSVLKDVEYEFNNNPHTHRH